MHENSKLKPGENMLCTEIVSDIQNNFLYTTWSPHILQKKKLLTKIYLYEERSARCSEKPEESELAMGL